MSRGTPLHAFEGTEVGLLLPQARDRVVEVEVDSRVRPAFLQDDLGPVPLTACAVDTPGVGEVQRLLHGVRLPLLALARSRAGLQVRGEEVRERDPGGRGEDRRPAVGDQDSVGSAQGRHLLSIGVEAGHQAKGPVPDVERSLFPPEVAQDVGAGTAADPLGEPEEGFVQLGLVPRVDGDQLPAGPPGRVLGVHDQRDVLVQQVLERQAVRDAVVPHVRAGPVRLVQGGGDVDLPALLGEVRVLGEDHVPQALHTRAPAGRRLPVGDGEPCRGAQRPGGVIGDAGRCLVEGPVREGVHLDEFDHWAPRVAVGEVWGRSGRFPLTIRSRMGLPCAVQLSLVTE